VKLSNLTSGKTIRTVSILSTLARAGLALSRNRPKRALLLAATALISVKSTTLGTGAQILLELFERRR
jgi:hypothetical protein